MVLYIGIGIILLIFFMGALVVDLPMLERRGRMLQRSVDAAGLAASTQLRPVFGWNGTTAPPPPPLAPAWNPCVLATSYDPAYCNAARGWLAAKRSAFAFLFNNRVQGDQGALTDTLLTLGSCVGGGSFDQVEADLPPAPNTASYACRTYESSGLVSVTLDRGFYYRPIVAGVFGDARFISLEEGEPPFLNGLCVTGAPAWVPGTTDVTNYGPLSLGMLPCPDGSATQPLLPNYAIANAVRMEVTIMNSPTLLARVPGIGVPTIGRLSRVTLAAP